jgi:uncharacterized protein
MRVANIVATLALFTVVVSAKPSWCRYAHTYVEKKICRTPHLIDLDYELTNVYKRVKSILRDDRTLRKELIRSERDWVIERDTDCYHRSSRCIARKYRQRINYLYRYLDDLMLE